MGREHADTATSLNILADPPLDQGDLVGRGRSMSARWRSARRCSAPSIPTPRRVSTTSPICCWTRATSWGARPLYERALAISEKVLGTEHPDTATSLSNLADLLRDQGDLAEARALRERALAIRERRLAPSIPFTAASLSSLANLLQAQGDLGGRGRSMSAP